MFTFATDATQEIEVVSIVDPAVQASEEAKSSYLKAVMRASSRAQRGPPALCCERSPLHSVRLQRWRLVSIAGVS